MKSKEEIFAELYDTVCEEHLTYPFHRSSERTSLAIQKSVFDAMERYAIEKQLQILTILSDSPAGVSNLKIHSAISELQTKLKSL